MKQTQNTAALRCAAFGTVSHGTLRTADLIDSLGGELERLVFMSGAYFAAPENHMERDRLLAVAFDAFETLNEDGSEVAEGKDEEAQDCLTELFDALSTFAPAYSDFCACPGDGSDFGFWPDVDAARDNVEFTSTTEQEYPDAEFRGEWLHVNERGNCTLYVRELTGKSHLRDGVEIPETRDREVWGIV
jgi:hypothetical protein